MASQNSKLDKPQDPLEHMAGRMSASLALSTKAVHGDDHLNATTDVAPPIHVSTTFRYSSNPDELIPIAKIDPEAPFDGHVYSRETAPSTTRLEGVLSSVLHGPTVAYTSGLAAFHAMITHLGPKRISMSSGGYHGCHGVADIHRRLYGLQVLPLDCPADDIQPGDIIHIETPLNPTGEATNLRKYAEKAHSRGAYLTVDGTFGPPPLQDPFAMGADIVMHSGTKYIGGHSDMLLGILAVNPSAAGGGGLKEPGHGAKLARGLLDDRTYLGSVPGNLEAWLGLRSVRTVEMRVQRQSENAAKLVAWFHTMMTTSAKGGSEGEGEGEGAEVRALVDSISHASLQQEDIDEGWLPRQMPGGYGPVFAVTMREESVARRLPSRLKLFHHATSLGGVESLIEWRAMSDAKIDTRLLRVSVGIEGWEDLRDDLQQAIKQLAAEAKAP